MSSSQKTGRNQPCPCGSHKKFKHCCGKLPTGATPRPPRPVELAARDGLLKAFGHFQRGELDEADRVCRQLLQSNPKLADAIHLSGLVMQAKGQLDDALACIDKALQLGPNFSMHSNRGIVLQAMGRMQDARAAYDKALAQSPNSFLVHANLGVVLSAMGMTKESGAAFEASLGLAPGNAHALNGLGWCKLQEGRVPQAIELFHQACAADPGWPTPHSNLAQAFLRCGQTEAALIEFKRSFLVEPSPSEVWEQFGKLCIDTDNVPAARDAFAKADSHAPSPARRLLAELSISRVHPSATTMREERQALEHALDRLLGEVTDLDEPTPMVFAPSVFLIAYHGDDVLPTLRKFARLYQRIFPRLAYRAPHLAQRRLKSRPTRVGFFSVYIHDHPVSRCFARMVSQLSRERGLEVLLVSPHERAVRGDPYAEFKGRFVRVPGQVYAAREAIAALELDLIVYLDIGMDFLSYFLGFARLAHRQVVMGGHPTTTGLPEIDVYVSSAFGEPGDAQDHYSERLATLDSGTVAFEKPKLPERLKTRTELGLPPTGSLYICPMMLQKIHPDFDRLVAGILQADPTGHVVFVKHFRHGWERKLEARLDSGFPPEIRSRVLFLPWIANPDDFLALNAHASVVLDPIHFGMGSTAVATFAVGTPIVTWPARFLRGRVGLAYCRLLGLDECVATDHDDYVRRAVRIATDPALRAALSQRIVDGHARFFDSPGYAQAVRAFVLDQAAELQQAAPAQPRA